MTTTYITEADFLNASNKCQGWCPGCRAFTRDGTEPDARGYDCEVCDGHEVVGAEEAMVRGMFGFREDLLS